MLKGFTTPLSPQGKSGLVPPPPWHNSGSMFCVEYWGDPDAIERFLPPGFERADQPDYCIAHFVEWQSCTDSQAELLDPVRAQYMEFFVIIPASYKGEQTFICPFMYVNNDINMYRGLLQGLPKQQASIYMTRSYATDNPSSGHRKPGQQYGGTLAYRDRRLANGSITLEERAETPPFGMAVNPVLGMRHFPDLVEGQVGEPVVWDIVAFAGTNRQIADVWVGDGALEYFPAPNQELYDLRPLKVGRACRYDMAYTIEYVRKLGDLKG